MIKYDLYNILKDELKNGFCDLVTRSSGQMVRSRIELDIEKEADGTVMSLDFSKIGIIDYSCADEIVAKLISRLLGGEYGVKYITLAGLNENQKENIEVALERKGLAVMAGMRHPAQNRPKENNHTCRQTNGGKILLGNINNYLKTTLDIILEKGKITAKELSEMMSLEANTSGTRLLNLHKKRLVKRTDEIKNGGRVWVYESI